MVGFEVLADDFESEVVEPAVLGQVRIRGAVFCHHRDGSHRRGRLLRTGGCHTERLNSS